MHKKIIKPNFIEREGCDVLLERERPIPKVVLKFKVSLALEVLLVLIGDPYNTASVGIVQLQKFFVTNY